MAKIYVADTTIISEQDLDTFISEFADGLDLDSIALSNHLVNTWTQFADDRHHATKPIHTVLRNAAQIKANLPQRAGVYGMFARANSSTPVGCFYIGMSSSNIGRRLTQHLRGDIRKDYRGGFGWLKRCKDIYTCCATLDSKHSNTEWAKHRLTLLETCLTVKLRPKFLLLAAGIPV